MLLLNISPASAQNTENWQWAKRGGGPGQFTTNALKTTDFERVVDIAIDSDNNYYFLAEISGSQYSDVDYDGMSLNTYNGSDQKRDIYVFSTDPEGDFRWDKVIGGSSSEHAITIDVDNQDNVYVSGRTYPHAGGTNVHFDTDSIKDVPNDPLEISSAYKGAFLIKYDQEGNFQWLREPEGESALLNLGISTLIGWMNKTFLEDSGRSHNLTHFREGTHLNGELIVPEGERRSVIVIYDQEGELEDFLIINMEPLKGFYNYQLAYDPDLERYYIADQVRGNSPEDVPSINGYGEEDDEHGFYLAALDNQGEVLWYHQNTRAGGGVGDLQLDEEGNIFFTGRFSGFSADEEPDSFAGYAFGEAGESPETAPFLIKMDPDGSLIWGSHAHKSSRFSPGGLAFYESYVYLGLPIQSNTWGNLTIPSGPEGVGYVPDPVIIRFDAKTGQSLDVFWAQGSDLSRNGFTALKTDNNGDLIGGGYFAQSLFFGEEFSLSNQAGGPSDFFIAKNQPVETPCLVPTALAVEKIGEDSVKITWQPRQGETQWQVNYGERLFPPTYHKDYNPYLGGNVEVVNDTPELVIEGLDFTARHAVFVRAVCNEDHESGWSAPVWFDLDNMQDNLCAQPEEILIENLTDTSAYISWSAQNEETEWLLAYGYPGFDPNTEGNTLTVEGEPEVTLEDLQPDKDYQVYIRALCNVQNLSSWTNPEEFSTLNVKTIDKPSTALKIYPNPTTGILNLQSEMGLESYQLYDLQGRIVKQGKLIDTQIDLSGIDNGLYFLRVRDQAGNVENLKVVKES